MIELVRWATLAASMASGGASALALGYALSTRRESVAKARRRAASEARAAIFEYWRAADKDIRELERRIEWLEAERHSRPVLTIARTGDEPDLSDAA